MSLFLTTKRVYARERLTATSLAVKQLTATLYDQNASPKGGNQAGVFKRRATGAVVRPCTGSGTLSFSVDGTDPTAGVTASDVGEPVAAGETIILESHDAIAAFKAIALSADAIFEVWYAR